jgi:hypothetical protein
VTIEAYHASERDRKSTKKTKGTMKMSLLVYTTCEMHVKHVKRCAIWGNGKMKRIEPAMADDRSEIEL